MRGSVGRGSQRGSITAEFAVVLPAVLLVLMLAITALQVGGRQVRLQSAAADVARQFARGDSSGAGRAREQLAGASVTLTRFGDESCAELRAPAGGGLLAGVPLVARSCALAEPVWSGPADVGRSND